MKFEKAPAELVEFISEKMKNIESECRQMFGYPAYFIHGNMFAGLFGDRLLLRLPDSDTENALKNNKGVKLFEPMPGRVMKGYISLPKAVYSDTKEFDKLLDKSVKYVSSMPPKKPKAKRGFQMTRG